MVSSNPSALADLRNVSINKSLPVEKKIHEFVSQVDPYRFMIGNVRIDAIFAPDAPPLEDGYRRLRA